MLSEQAAEHRAAALKTLAVAIEMDLRGADNQKEHFFRTKTTWQIISENKDLFLDFVGEVLFIDGPANMRWEHREEQVRISGLPTKTPFTLQIYTKAAYSRTGEGLHRVLDTKDGQCYLYTHCEPDDARRYFPCFDQPSIKTPVTWSVLAPQNWKVITNGICQEKISATMPGYTQWKFLPTKPLPAYLIAMCAGPYEKYEDTYVRKDNTKIKLGLYCRRSRATDFDPEDIFTITKQGLEYFEDVYKYTYPWGKYDQIFVPEYNIGAMENPGCVTFNEDDYVFSGPPTDAGRAKRADTILHEMCHMWFGNLVTPFWWDDLWLKESFADYSGHTAAKIATRYKDEDAAISVGRKEWAYRFDQYPSTHPILAQVRDTQMARQTFDAITYAKGASALRQLVAAVGEDNFHRAISAFFKDNEHSTARLADFLKSMNNNCDLDLNNWAQQWLETVGPSQLHLELRTDGNGVLSEAKLVQENRCHSESVQEVQSTVIRPHLLRIGCYDLSAKKAEPVVVLRKCLEVFTDQDSKQITELVGKRRPDLLLLNDSDLTYAICILDRQSQDFLVSHLSLLPSLDAQGVAWSTLWNAVRDTRLPAPIFAQALLKHLPALQSQSMLVTLLDRAWYTLARYLIGSQRQDYVHQFLGLAWDRTRHYTAADSYNVGLARAWVGGVFKFCSLAANTGNKELAAQILTEINSGSVLELDDALRWVIAEAQASINALSTSDLEQLAMKDPSVSGKASYLKVSHLFNKTGDDCGENSVGRRIVQDSLRDHSNEELAALGQAFNRPDRAAFCSTWTSEYLDIAAEEFSKRSGAMALKWVRAFFPAWIEAKQEDCFELVWHIDKKLEEWSKFPNLEPLHRAVVDSLSELKRDLAVQRKALVSLQKLKAADSCSKVEFGGKLS